MEGKVKTLESEMRVVRSTLAEVQNALKENHANLIAMLEKCLGKLLRSEKESACDEGSSGKGSSGTKGRVQNHHVTDFLMKH